MRKTIKSLFYLTVIIVTILFSKKVILKFKANFEYERSLSGQLSDAEKIKYLKQAIQNDPGNAKYYKEIGMIRLKQADQAPGKKPDKYKLANKYFKKAIFLNPSNYIHHYDYATSIYKETKDVKKLIKFVKTANKLNPTNEKLSKYLEELKPFSR